MWDECRAGSNPIYAADFKAQGLKTDHVLDFSKRAAIRNGINYHVQAASNQTVYVVPVTGGGAYSRPDRISCRAGCG